GHVDAAELIAGAAAHVRHAAAGIHVRVGGVRAGGGGLVAEAVSVAGDGGEGRAAAGRYVRGVDPVRAVLVQVVLHGGGESAHADRGQDARDAGAHVRQLQRGDVLAHAGEGVGQAGPGPVRAAVVREIEPGLRAGHDAVAVVRIDAHFADGLVLRELAGRLRQRRAEDVGGEDGPVRAGVGGFEYALAAHGECAVIEVAGAGVDGVVIVRIDGHRVDAGRGDQRIVGDDGPGGGAAAAVRGLPH